MEDESLGLIKALQDMLVDRATGAFPDEAEYASLRARLISDEAIRPYLPRFVQSCRDLSQFWGFIKPKFDTYHERRTYIWQEFAPLFDKFEGHGTSMADVQVSAVLSDLDVDHIVGIWDRALMRRTADPEGAITSARTLLESVCKSILDDFGERYAEKADLPKLYHLTARCLKLAPEQHTEDVFKQILGGCQSVVGGLGSLRNKLGDAHGKGRNPVRPASRHAELAVNLAGSMAVFLVRTWEFRKKADTSQ